MAEQKTVKWYTIKVDAEVFGMLQRHAQPLVDTANDVLRKILLKQSAPATPRKARKIAFLENGEIPLVDSTTFVQLLLQDRFGDNFYQVGRYQYMFESENHLVYFQNQCH